MTLITSISGIRGTIGGKAGNSLSPIDIAKFTAAFGTWLLLQNPENKTVVIGRDARPSGNMVQAIVQATLQGLGINVVDAGLATTPTVEMAVAAENACGGIIITASHNPKNWNALKLLNSKGEFISAKNGEEVLQIAENQNIEFATVENLGSYTQKNFLDFHIQKILELPLINRAAIAQKNFTITIDAINSVGAIAVPTLLKALGINNIVAINAEPNGNFAHNPEPLPEHLQQITTATVQHSAHVGIVVDPDVDRLALICEDGSFFGEEYTLVAVADYVLQHQQQPACTVSNLSSSKALKDVTNWYKGTYNAAAVGEVNVVNVMKSTNAVLGGEGNGGIIYPPLHYGRDALVGIALFLSHLATQNINCTALRNKYPTYFMVKAKIELPAETPPQALLQIFEDLKNEYSKYNINTTDGLKITFETGDWVHLRRSNTEPIIRIYTESTSVEKAQLLADNIKKIVAQKY